MKRYIFSVDSGQAKVMPEELFKSTWASYSSQDPGLKYLRVIQYKLDPDDLMDINLLERHRYKDSNRAIAERFQSYATETAAGLADIFKAPYFHVLYVCVETTEDTYELSVLQNMHPRSISGSRTMAPVPRISEVKGAMEIRHRIAEKVAPLKRTLAEQKAKAVADLRGGDMDM